MMAADLHRLLHTTWEFDEGVNVSRTIMLIPDLVQASILTTTIRISQKISDANVPTASLTKLSRKDN